MQDTMKVEKMTPKGSPPNSSPSGNSAFASVVKAGVHMKTKMYIDPSKREEITPQDRISALRMVAVKAPFRAPMAEDFPDLLSSSLSTSSLDSSLLDSP